jgi:hypothetical protein
MAASKFTDEVRLGILELIADGATLGEACQQNGVRLKTVKDWLTRGRKPGADERDADAPYFDFAAAYENAKGEFKEDASKEMDEDEFLGHLTRMVRAGNINAMKLWWDVHRDKKADDDKPGDDLGF